MEGRQLWDSLEWDGHVAGIEVWYGYGGRRTLWAG